MEVLREVTVDTTVLVEPTAVTVWGAEEPVLVTVVIIQDSTSLAQVTVEGYCAGTNWTLAP